MQRYKLILGGTVAGIAGVLMFPTKSPHLSAPTASGAAGSSTGGTASSPSPEANGTSTGNRAPSDSTTTPTTTPTTSGLRSATSADESFRYGDIALTVTVDGPKITNIAVATLNETDDRSAAIDNYAVPQLEQQVISADSVNVDGVSGATFTSQAFVDAVANALQKLGLRA